MNSIGYGTRLILAGMLLTLTAVAGIAALTYASLSSSSLTPTYAQGGMATSTPSRFADNDDDETCDFRIETTEKIGQRRDKPMEFSGTTANTNFVGKRPRIDGQFKAANTRGSLPCQWRGKANVSWITLQPAAGTTAANRQTTGRFTVNENALDLEPGTHKAVITFSITSGFFHGSKELHVALEITHPCRLRTDGDKRLVFAMQDGQDPGSLEPQQVTIKNLRESATCDWQANPEQSWLDIKPSSGELAAGQEEQIEVSLNPVVKNLEAQDGYAINIEFMGGDKELFVEGHLDIAPSPCRLSLDSTDDFNASGPYGGPFTPAEISLRLINTGGSACHWKAAGAGEWASVLPLSGTIKPDESEAIELKLAAAVQEITPGAYDETITFSTGDGVPEVSVDINLEVAALPCEFTARAVAGLDFSRDSEGDYNRDSASIEIGNARHRATCKWSASGGEWLAVNPSQGELAAGATAMVTATLDQDRADALAPQQSHQDSIKFTNQTGTPTEVELLASLELKCLKDRPCAVMHSDRNEIRYGESVETTLTLHNRSDSEITATLTLNPPNGWSLTAGDFGGDCGSGCTRQFRIPAGQSADISIQAEPNAPSSEAKEGIFNGNASYFYSDRPDETTVHDIAAPVTVHAASPEELAAKTPAPAPTALPPTPEPTAAVLAGPVSSGGAAAATPTPTPVPAGGTTEDLNSAAAFWLDWRVWAAGLALVIIAAGIVVWVARRKKVDLRQRGSRNRRRRRRSPRPNATGGSE